MRCEDLETAHIFGEFQYHDHSIVELVGGTFNGVAVHGVIDALIKRDGQNTTCNAMDESHPGTFEVLGFYTPQPKTRGEGGQFHLVIQDQNNTDGLFCDPGVDALGLVLSGGVYDGYAEQGCLEKGNFTVFTE